MKAQKQPGKLEATASILDNLKTIILTIIGLAILIGVIIAVIKVQSEDKADGSISIEEAQAKCMLIDEYNQVTELGKTFSQDVVNEAERFCLAQWDTPEREKDFKNSIPKDWEAMKDKVLDGYTLEQLYEEAHPTS